ncbi:hypothetical protein ACFFGH_32360 [Lysobacter korlensis]|uniref:Lipoprotein n=1 Tax=Lysobacter korlensis TaxID=553636 RepID=A0ABV6RZY1_9GAMM
MRRLGVIAAVFLAPAVLGASEAEQVTIEVFREPPLLLLQVGALAGDGLIERMTQAQGPVPKEVSVSHQLADSLLVELAARDMPLGPVPTEAQPQKRGRSLSGDKPSSLQVFTDYSAISYLPFRWGTYQYGMKGRARFIDSNGKVVWEKKCYIKHTKEDPRFQITKEGFDSEGRRIQEVVQAAAQECARLIAKEI